MKNLFVLIFLTVVGANALAQSKYEQAMKASLETFSKANSNEELLSIAGKFEQISEVESAEWLPGYYAAMIYCIASFRTSDITLKTQLVAKAQAAIDNIMPLAEKESEVHTLQGMVYQATITIDPMQYGQSYSAKANGSFKIAQKLNPNNPRPFYLQAVSLLNTPEQFGGGKRVAKPMLAGAMQLFEQFEPANELQPNWGKEDCAKQLAACSAE